MPRVSETGQITGSSVSDYDTQAAGTFACLAAHHRPGCGGEHRAKLTVNGKTPATNYQFSINWTTAKVEQLLGTLKPPTELMGAFADVYCMANYTKDSLATLTMDLSEVLDGQVFRSGADLWMKVGVYDENGSAIAAGEGNNWVLKLSATEVTELAEATSVELRSGQPVDIKLA